MDQGVSPVEIHPVQDKRDHRVFLHFPWRIYRHDRYWVPPLLSEMEAKFDSQRNSFFKSGEMTRFLAYRGHQLVGRVAAIIDRRSNEQLGERVGLFGFFEAIDDLAVAEVLLGAAGDWLQARGMDTIRGPINFSLNDEHGLLIAGYNSRPSLLEAHNPPYYVPLIESLGFRKQRDVYAYEGSHTDIRGDLANLPPKMLRVAEAAYRRTKATIRAVDLNRWDKEVALAHHIYDTALSTLPLHVTISEEEFDRLASSFRPFLDPDLALVAEVEGQAVAFVLTLPDINQALQKVNGRLFPLGWAKLWWYMRRIDVASCKVLAVLPEYRGRGLEALLMLETAKRCWEKGYQRMDFSMTGEENVMMNRILQRTGAHIYRHYRIYEKGL